MAKYLITALYNDTVEPPKRKGGLAIQVVCIGEVTKNMEVEALDRRTDVDYTVEVIDAL